MASVLLVEDSITQAEMIRGLLESAGYNVTHAEDGQQAISKIQQQQPDVLLTDLMMPNMNGCELTRHVVEHYPTTPVLVFTARGSESLAVDALADGAVNFVPKALLEARLIPAVNELADRVRVDSACCESGAHLVVPELIFELDSDPRAILPVTRYIQKTLAFADVMDVVSRFRTTSAISAALINAICYGNLEMREDEEAIYRLMRGEVKPADVPHKVRLVVSVGVQDTRVLVTHDGPGAMTRTSPAPGTPESFELEDCRGLLLVTSFMDKVIYHQLSNEIVMVKDTSPKLEPPLLEPVAT
ncbi:response regulator [Planctomycetes bacterium K23_9]|uniref:Chemotaxis protein CheY n=1 Tax=Stieleria marina TaxID=1930275 RepID=A0A517P2B8_9BACT|nr:Chemotaxis protein CheY [Planctomycetes bacterium K23_9]